MSENAEERRQVTQETPYYLRSVRIKRKYEWVQSMLEIRRNGGVSGWPTAPAGIGTKELLAALRGPWLIWGSDEPTKDVVIRPRRRSI